MAGHITAPLLDLREPSLGFFSGSWSSPSLFATTQKHQSKNNQVVLHQSHQHTGTKQNTPSSAQTKCTTSSICRCLMSWYLVRAQLQITVSKCHTMQNIFSETPMLCSHKCRQSSVESSTLLTRAESNPSSISHTWADLIGTAYCYHCLCFIHCTHTRNN